jgi:hypothetical protein
VSEAAFVLPVPVVADERIENERVEAATSVDRVSETEESASEPVTVEAAPPFIETIDDAIVDTIEVAPALDVTRETPAPGSFEPAIVSAENTSTSFDTLPESAVTYDPDETATTTPPAFAFDEEVTIEHAGFDIAPVTSVETRAHDAQLFGDTEIPAATPNAFDSNPAQDAIETPAVFDFEHTAVNTEPHATESEWFDLDTGTSLSSYEPETAFAPAPPDAAPLEQPAAIADALAPRRIRSSIRARRHTRRST